jgi:hypothetical protein
MKFFFTILCLHCFLGYGITQQIDSAKIKDTLRGSLPTTLSKKLKPEILTNGFIDIVNNGQVNAAARFIRLYIGEQGKFAIPLSFYGGVSSNNFQNTNSLNGNSNKQLVNSFINPLSGLVNVSVDGVAFFDKSDSNVTRVGGLYQVGARVLTGYVQGAAGNPQTGSPVNFVNGYLTAGLYFQTGAWERNNAGNTGIFWASWRWIVCYSSASSLKEFLPSLETDGYYHGYCLGMGVEINNLVNIKILYYKYFKAPEIDFNQSIYQFTFNYSLR